MSHLTKANRHHIEQLLRQRRTLREIARILMRPYSTIKREVLKHRQANRKAPFGRIANSCIFRRNCDRRQLCSDRKCNRRCSACPNCNLVCKDYREECCPKLAAPPFVCNGCPEDSHCTLHKQFYIYDIADEEYHKTLVHSRQGFNLTEEERKELSARVYAGIEKGQSLHHIMVTDKDSFTVCEKTVYNYVNAGVFTSKRGDMPCSCMRRPRKSKKVEHKVDPKCRNGRTYDDFKKFCESNDGSAVVEMDSVIGRRGGKVLLTLQFNVCGLMLAFLRDNNTSQSVIDKFNYLETTLGLEVFQKLFPVILTDNGSEFSNPEALEFSPISGVRRTRIFFCWPYASWQKGHVENNHLNLRKILEKGSSFDHLNQQDVNLVLSHLNSYARKNLNDVPAITLFKAIYGVEPLKQLGLHLIDPREVTLLPELIKSRI